MNYISNRLIEKFSSGPSEYSEDGLRTTRDKIVELLGSDYEVFLQGSYKNDTAIYDINDIDIVAVRVKNIPKLWDAILWENIFDDIQKKILSFSLYSGKVIKENKCIKLQLQKKKADIVPAVRHDVYEISRNGFNEPIQVFDRLTQRVINNYPKTHYDLGAKLNQLTNGNYKKCVRLMKNFVKNHDGTKVAPSFYIECLIHSYNEQIFVQPSIESFYYICDHIANGADFNMQFKSVAGDKIIIQNEEWSYSNFSTFKNYLRNKLLHLKDAIGAQDNVEADKHFKLFFNL